MYFINLDISDILFGTQILKGKNISLNVMILLAKYFIYITKCNKERLTIAKYKRVIQFWFNAEKYNTFMECNWKGFEKKWAYHKHLFQN